jgi:enoyl-CoA hydratase
MTTAYETLTLEERDYTLLVTLNRPAVANAISTQVGRDLLHLFASFALTPERYRCIVLTGAGDRAFSAGGDLKERNGMTDEQWQSQHLVYEQMIRAIIDCPIPMIAAVNGAAYAGGLEIALGCDFIYASHNARFALTEVRIGIMPGAGGTQNLARAVGERRAKELILTATPFSAEEAHAWGLVNRLCEPGTVVTEALATAKLEFGHF